jgi:aromatic-L-amino-acid/L-tryptophan decarboxylase
LSIVCFRYVPASMQGGRAADEPALDQLNLALIDAVRATGRASLSSTRLRGRTAIRFCFLNWRTTAADVEEVVRLLVHSANSVSRDSLTERGGEALRSRVAANQKAMRRFQNWSSQKWKPR